MSEEPNQAVIYCRVSSTKQTVKGDGLGSQETRCREYASYRGMNVIEIFKDDLSGGLIDRPGMQAMLKFMRRRKPAATVCIIDDISRLARGLEAHLALRSAIAEAGGVLESPSVEFGEDSHSILVERVLATVSEHQRLLNGEQVRNRMRARLMNGYWVFRAPVGYRYKRVKGRGKILLQDEPLASIVREGLEGFASGRFQTQAEVGRFFEKHPEFPRNKHGEVRRQQVADILGRSLYAGIVEATQDGWDVSARQGHHEGLIEIATYRKVQERLNETAHAPARKNLDIDFPLRGFVQCGCGSPYTASWTKGRNKHYPYYVCQNRKCDDYGKSIRRDQIEGEFGELLASYKPSPGLLKLALAMFRDQWEHQLAFQNSRREKLRAQLATLERKTSQLVSRVVNTDSPSLINAYEEQIKEMERQKLETQETIGKLGRPLRHFDELYRTACAFLANPCFLWSSKHIEDKRAVLKLTFRERPTYVRNEGYRTAETTLPFKLLEHFGGGNVGMVGPPGLEPGTNGL